MEGDHHVRSDLFVAGQGEGGYITRMIRGARLRGALRGVKPSGLTQGGSRGLGQMSRR